jgi:hypothetical protein
MTDTINTWPDPGKPGVPLNPTEDEPHWLSWRDEKPRAVEWDSQSLAPVEDEDKQGFWRFGDLYGTPEQVAADGWTYLGPCLTPDQATALQARVTELEGALKDAAASVKEWGAYASQYLQEKWDLPGEVARYVAIAEGKNDAALEGEKELPTMTEEQLREMMRDPRYWRQREPEWVKRVTDGFRALAGGKKDE